MNLICTCGGCGMSWTVIHVRGNPPRWCEECKSVPYNVPAGVFIATRLATYSAATRLALCHIQRHEYAQATAVLTAAKDAA